MGARLKSEADFEEIMDNLQEQVMEDKKMRSYAVIPPIMLDARERKLTFKNNNGHIVDMETVHKSRQYLNIWTAAEKEVFKEKYLQHPKNFVVIASYLEKKSVADCVQNYYLSKKTESYKQLLRKSRQRTRTRNPPKGNQQVVDILTPGVTTRLQREQQQKTGGRSDGGPETTLTTTTVTTSSATTVVSRNGASTPTPGTASSGTETVAASSPGPTPVPCSVISAPANVTTATVTFSVAAATVKTEDGVVDDVKSFSEMNCVATVDEKKFNEAVMVKTEINFNNEDSLHERQTPLVPIMTGMSVKKEETMTENSGR